MQKNSMESALIPHLFLLLDGLDHVELGEVLVAVVLPLLVGLLVGEELAHVDADEGALRDVRQRPDAPVPLLRLEHLWVVW